MIWQERMGGGLDRFEYGSKRVALARILYAKLRGQAFLIDHQQIDGPQLAMPSGSEHKKRRPEIRTPLWVERPN